MLRLSEFHFDVIHRAGIKNPATDALLRLATQDSDKMSLEDDIPELSVSLVQQTTPNNDERDGKLAGECCVRTSCDTKSTEVPAALTERVAFGRAHRANTATEEFRL